MSDVSTSPFEMQDLTGSPLLHGRGSEHGSGILENTQNSKSVTFARSRESDACRNKKRSY